MVHVTVFGALRDRTGKPDWEIELPAGSCVADAIAAVGLADRVDLWVLLDGKRAKRSDLLGSDSVLTFFQPTGGG